LNEEERAATIAALSSFGPALDVTPRDDQPLHALLKTVALPKPWSARTQALIRFAGWPATRPDFFIETSVVNSLGQPPRSHSDEVVLGAIWRRFSYSFGWDASAPDPVRAVQLWLGRFREST
jgi:hypothetical protein